MEATAWLTGPGLYLLDLGRHAELATQLGAPAPAAPGVPTPVARLLPAASENTIACLAAGERHVACAADDGALMTWGDGALGRLGRTSEYDRSSEPAVVSSLDMHVVSRVACGLDFTVCLTRQGVALSCGNNENGQLGRDAAGTPSSPRPVVLPPGHFAVQVSCGAEHALLLTQTGAVVAWGANYAGQLGIGRCGPPAAQPVVVESLAGRPVVRIACGTASSAAVTASGMVYTWGTSAAGVLGHGPEALPHQGLPVPKLVEGLVGHHVVDMASGHAHSILLMYDGSLFSFGAPNSPALGRRSADAADGRPAAIALDFAEVHGDDHVPQWKALSVTAGRHFSAALLQDRADGAGQRLVVGLMSQSSVRAVPFFSVRAALAESAHAAVAESEALLPQGDSAAQAWRAAEVAERLQVTLVAAGPCAEFLLVSCAAERSAAPRLPAQATTPTILSVSVLEKVLEVFRRSSSGRVQPAELHEAEGTFLQQMGLLGLGRVVNASFLVSTAHTTSLYGGVNLTLMRRFWEILSVSRTLCRTRLV
jgi:hypothetical protein